MKLERNIAKKYKEIKIEILFDTNNCNMNSNALIVFQMK